MLVVVEGPSVVGKTSFLQWMHPEQVVVEEVLRIPPGAGPMQVLPYGLELSTQRWGRMLRVEADYGTAYADSDPLKLYYDFALVMIGEPLRDVFEEGWRLFERAMADRKVGFAEHVVYLTASPERLTERKLGDTSRRRGKFGLHVRLGSAMEAYYLALERLRPGTVCWVDAEADVRGAAGAILPALAPHGWDRYDLSILRELKRDLDHLLEPGGGGD